MQRDEQRVGAHLREVSELLGRLSPADVTDIARRIVTASERGNSVFVMGNGGSAATASHFVTDLTKGAAVGGRFVRARALTDNLALLTATANDLGYERIFAEPLAREASPGDLLIAISGSGKSPNILYAVDVARERGLSVIGLCGFSGGRLAPLCDAAITVDGTCIQVVEDVHSAVTHAIATAVRDTFQESLPRSSAVRSAVIVDRDGVLNIRRHDHVRRWEDFEFLPGALEALAELKARHVPVIVTTNQAVIGRDGISAAVVDDIHRRMCRAVESAGGLIEAVLVCPHAPSDSCACRKPRPGLLYQAATERGIDLGRSVLIGDSPSDVAAARAAGCRPILLVSDSGRALDVTIPAAPDLAASLLDAVNRYIIEADTKATLV